MPAFSAPVDCGLERDHIKNRICLTLFSYLDTADLLRATAVSRYWRELLHNDVPHIWTALTDPPVRFIRTAARRNTVTSLDISFRDVQHFEAVCRLLPRLLPTLVELNLYFYTRPSHLFPFRLLWDVLKTPAPKLQSLCLRGEWVFLHEAQGIPAGLLLGGETGNLRKLVLGGFRPIDKGMKGYPAAAFGRVEVLDITSTSLAEVITTQSQYKSLREITIHGVEATTKSLRLPRSASKVQVNFSTLVTSAEAEKWLRDSGLEQVNEVFASMGAGYLLGAVAGRNILGISFIAIGPIFGMETRVDRECVRRAFVTPEEVNDVLAQLASRKMLQNMLCVHLEGLAAHRLLPVARLEEMPKLDVLSLAASVADIRASVSPASLIDLFADDTFIGMPRLSGVQELVLLGERGFDVEVEKKHVVQFLEEVTPAVRKLRFLDVSPVGNLNLPEGIKVHQV